jgi:hypothetical protein
VQNRRSAPSPSFLSRLSGRADPTANPALWRVLAAAAFFGALLVLVVIYWSDAGAFIYEGF